MKKNLKHPANQPRRLESHEQLGTDRHLRVKISDDIVEWPLHWHDYFEIEILLDSSGEYTLDEITYDLTKCNAFFLTPIDFHQFQDISLSKLINISFDETMLSSKYLSIVTSSTMEHAFCLSPEEQARVSMAASLLLHECEINGNCQRQLFEYILECLLKSSSHSSIRTASSKLSGIEKAILYMEMHFREQIDLSSLAQLTGFHPNYFSELFHKITGKTYTEKLNQLRADYACVLLRNGFSVSDACFSSGFGSLSNFLSTFKARYGISPNEYKKQSVRNNAGRNV